MGRGWGSAPYAEATLPTLWGFPRVKFVALSRVHENVTGLDIFNTNTWLQIGRPEAVTSCEADTEADSYLPY
jgi:hypothetical protein